MPTSLINRESDLPAVAKRLLLAAGDRRIFLLEGTLGAGKTTLIKQLCASLGVDPSEVHSPTYALVNEYEGMETVYHLDLYRLKSLDEAIDIGIEDILYSGQYCFIEWPELIEPILPAEVIRIKLELAPDSARKILF
jgi:tRNA threonylcarbamoyladenosine biosynthesis protein TsaE